MLGLALTLAGAGGLGELDPLGIGLSILAAFAQAFYVLAARHGFPDIQPIEAAATTMGLATIGYVVIAHRHRTGGCPGRAAGSRATR